MGFFDSMKAILDTRRWYTEPRLYQYFQYEIYGTTNPEGFKDKVTTNIREILDSYIKEYYPEAHLGKTKIEDVYEYTGDLEKCNDTIYRIPFRGRIQVYNVYGDHEGTLYYLVVVYTDKYAVLSTEENQKTTITVSKKVLKDKK